MAGLVPAIHAFAVIAGAKTWMPGTRPGMTKTTSADSSMLRHHAPFGDHGVAHLPGFLGTGDLIDLYRDFLADKALQLRRLGIIGSDDLKGFRSGFQPAQSGRARQP